MEKGELNKQISIPSEPEKVELGDLITSLPVEFLSQENFEEALRLALSIIANGTVMFGINTWAEAEVTRAGE